MQLERLLTEVLRNLNLKECTDNLVPKLLIVAELICSIDRQLTVNLVVSLVEKFPNGSLIALSKLFRPSNMLPQHLFLQNVGIMNFLPSAFCDSHFSFISLSHNALKHVPQGLFQLQLLTGLDLSHNLLESLPPILEWNCPRLKELDVSHNNLIDSAGEIIKNSLIRINPGVVCTPGMPREHAEPDQKLFKLTGHHFYACIHSLNSVNLSKNEELSEIPEWVCVLPNLMALDLKGLPKLKNLPLKLALWNNLLVIDLESKNMKSPPSSVCSQGTLAMIAYLRCHMHGCMPFRHMKIMILGMEQSGKHTVYNGLSGRTMSGASAAAGEKTSYDYRLPFQSECSVRVTYHLMHFNNEVIESSVYRCFLIHHCIYLCLWSAIEGKAGLEALMPILRNIQAHVPGACVILVITHMDIRPDITLSHILSWEQEVFNIDDPMKLCVHEYACSFGLPCLSVPILINSLSKLDIDKLKKGVHLVACSLKLENAQERLVELAVPRSFIALQSLIESKVKQLGYQASIIRYEELMDCFHSVSVHGSDLDSDEKEFSLACQFLHDTGVLFRFSCSGKGSVLFLNLQWLSDTLARVLMDCAQQVTNSNVVLHCKIIHAILEKAKVPISFQAAFQLLLEQQGFMIPFDTDKQSCLIPFAFPIVPPSDYPCYSSNGKSMLVRRVTFAHLPKSLFSLLQHCVLANVHHLGAKLLAQTECTFSVLYAELISSLKEEPAAEYGKFCIDRNGYIVRQQPLEDTTGRLEALMKVRVMCSVQPMNVRHLQDVGTKIQALSKLFLSHLCFLNCPDHSILLNSFSRCFLCKNKMYLNFLDGTSAWMEVNGSHQVTITTSGNIEATIKSSVFLLSCLETVCNVWYSKLERHIDLPCSMCLQRTTEKLCCNGVSDSSYSLLSLVLNKLSHKHKTVHCSQCLTDIPLVEIAPDLLLVDFPYGVLEEEELILEGTTSQLSEDSYSYVSCYIMYCTKCCSPKVGYVMIEIFFL